MSLEVRPVGRDRVSESVDAVRADEGEDGRADALPRPVHEAVASLAVDALAVPERFVQLGSRRAPSKS